MCRCYGKSRECRVRVENGVSENIAQREKAEKQIAALETKIRKEKQLNRQMKMNAEFKELRKELRESD